MSCGEMSVPYSSCRCRWISRTVIPLAYRARTLSSNPESPHVLGDNLRRKGPVPIAWDAYLHRAALGVHRLLRMAVAAVAPPASLGLLPLVVAEVLVHFDFEQPLHEGSFNFLEKARGTKQILW